MKTITTKDQTIWEAIDWQHDFDNHNYSYQELVEWSEHFTKTAKRFGPVKMFKKNGIIQSPDNSLSANGGLELSIAFTIQQK